MKQTTIALALGVGLLTAVAAATAPAGQRASDTVRVQVSDTRTEVVVAGDASSSHLLVALPPGASSCDARVSAGGGEVVRSHVGYLRGLPVASVTATGLDADAVVTVDHDGRWSGGDVSPARAHARGFDAVLDGQLAGLPAGAKSAANGVYLVVTTPEYVDACAPLLEWKRAKGLDVRLVTTDETGTGNSAIQSWLRDAYDTWDVPPEYLLIVGDVDDIPSWSFSENVTDQPYALMDVDDWLPDLLIGRIPVETVYEAQSVINKTVAYEKTPYRDDEGWLTRQLMVAGNYGSDTPVSTVTWCGEQLETLGWEPASQVSFPPLFNGVTPITNALEEGVSMCVYRGWAYGTAGWEPPHFTVSDIPNVENGEMLPVVMSFVCLNGDFSDDQACFGEVFLRQGTPSEPSGAVAFIGNGEHWSHTRYNDAMAISFFERIVDPGVTDLGALMLAGKLRFMDFFPHEMGFEEHGEESVEFYFHIYNLLGDPELNYWRGAPADLTVDHAATCAPDANRFAVTVTEADGTTPLAGARVGVTQDGVLVGSAFSGADGVAHVPLAGLGATEPLLVTVTRSDRFAQQSAVPVDQPESYLALTGLTWTSDAPFGNGDQVVNPSEVLTVHPEFTNTGTLTSSAGTATLTLAGPADVQQATFALPAIGGGEVYQTSGAEFFTLGLLSRADDGAELRLRVDADHDGATATSEWILTVGGPAISLEAVAVGGPGYLRQGQDSDVTLTVRNDGGLPLGGGHARLNLLTPGVGGVVTAEVDLPDVAPGATAEVTAPFVLAIDGDVPTGRGVGVEFVVSDAAEDYQVELTSELVVGDVDPGAPVGPDSYGYHALDSADIDYPDQVPTYRWTHLNPAYGGEGVEVPFTSDNTAVLVDLPFDFQYYGQAYTGQIRLSENGWISFDTSDEFEFYNWPLPSSHGNHSVVCPFWDNFDPTLEGTGGVFTRYDVGAGTFTVEWSNMIHYMSTVDDLDPPIDDMQTFQLVLHDQTSIATDTGDGVIEFLYRQVVNNDHVRQYASVGLENAEESDGLELSYAGLYAPGVAPIGPGLAIRLTTDVPVYDPYTVETFTAERSPAGVALAWSVDDERPLTGWTVRRSDANGDAELTLDPLPAGTREFLDTGAAAEGEVLYRLISWHPYGHSTEAGSATAESTTGSEGLVRFRLDPVQPNPARGDVRLGFALPQGGPVTLRVYDVAGRLVRELLDDERPSGPSSLTWDGRTADGQEAAAGVYFARLESVGRVLTQKLMLVR